jgi:predicted CoA-substrate-specific enzyme activase
MITVGIDIGSITTKIAIMNGKKPLYTNVIHTGYDADKAWQEILDNGLQHLGLSRDAVDRIVSTGYGRKAVVVAHKQITEIMCHAAGARYAFPKSRSVIDIGGQDSKFIRIGDNGSVADFVMNDKCAAGTGRFLEVMARALEVYLADFGRLSAKASRPAKISSMCTVFAESEVISLIAKGESRENIIAGIHASIANRVAAMAGRNKAVKPLVMTGGVAKNEGIKKALEEKLNMKISVAETAQVNGAIGAAVLARAL